jgi:hypothetical protein
MSNISYHGTNRKNAENIVGPPSKVDINVGKGELGKGFYTGSSIALAAIWARLRYPNDGVVIKFEIPEPNFVQLRGFVIKTKEDVISTWNRLKENGETTSFTFNHDYIISPLATIDESGYQLKFESQKAEKELNSSLKSIFPCGS